MADTDDTGTTAAQPKVAEATVAPQIQDPPRPRSALGPVLGGVVAALVGFAVAQLVPHGWPLGSTSTIEADIKAQMAQVDALKTQVLDLSQKLDSSKLAERVAKLEATPAPTAPADISGLEARVAALEAKPAGASADPAALAQIKSDIEVLKANGAGEVSPAVQASLDAKVKETEARLATIEETAKASAAAAISRAAVRQIAAALDSGTPYGAALADLGGANLPAVLTDHAGTGLPTLQGLQADFPDAARAALDASLRANMGATWSERVTNFLRTQTGARTLAPHAGSDPDAVLSRAQDDTAKGDLGAALKEIAGLPPEGLAALADWQARAQLRLNAAAAVQALMAQAG